MDETLYSMHKIMFEIINSIVWQELWPQLYKIILMKNLNFFDISMDSFFNCIFSYVMKKEKSCKPFFTKRINAMLHLIKLDCFKAAFLS